MKRAARLLGVLAAGIALTAATETAQAIEKGPRIQKSEMPEAVQATADRESVGATVKEYAKGVEKGQAVFVMDLVAGGHAKEILIGGDGNVVSVQEEVPFAQLPPEIQAGLQQQAGRGRIDRVVEISKNTAVTSYQARVAANGRTSRVEVGVDGNPPAPPGSPEPVP